jgi:type VI secretion system secreted protein VgrG
MPRNVTALIASNELSCDGLDITRLVARERISQLYEIEVDLVARQATATDGPSMIGAAVLIGFTADGAVERVIPGVVAEAVDRIDPISELRSYRLKIMPPAYCLTLVKLQEVFQGTVPHIIGRKLEQCGVDHEFRLVETYPEREYVAQFAETDLDFVSRLTEHLGISYYFTLTRERALMVFVDDNAHFIDAKETLAIPFRARGDRVDVFRFEAAAHMTPSLYLVSDYNYRTPNVELVGRCENPNGSGGGTIEYGVHVKTADEAQALARVRGQGLECRRVQFIGESDRAEISAGLMFSLDGHPHLGDRELLVTEVEHRIEQVATGGTAGTLAYGNSFRAIDAATPYRPEVRTPVPKVHGLMSGVVMPAPGSNATLPWLDDQGRYRIQLLFDTLAAGETEKSIRPLRMIQAHAGPGYGSHFPLRPGVEVMLGFVNGDVDRPVIVGAVPNTVTPSPISDSTAMRHRIRTASGVMIEFEDGY